MIKESKTDFNSSKNKYVESYRVYYKELKSEFTYNNLRIKNVYSIYLILYKLIWFDIKLKLVINIYMTINKQNEYFSIRLLLNIEISFFGSDKKSSK